MNGFSYTQIVEVKTELSQMGTMIKASASAPVKAKFHYAIWFEPASLMEFGFKRTERRLRHIYRCDVQRYQTIVNLNTSVPRRDVKLSHLPSASD